MAGIQKDWVPAFAGTNGNIIAPDKNLLPLLLAALHRFVFRPHHTPEIHAAMAAFRARHREFDGDDAGLVNEDRRIALEAIDDTAIARKTLAVLDLGHDTELVVLMRKSSTRFEFSLTEKCSAAVKGTATNTLMTVIGKARKPAIAQPR